MNEVDFVRNSVISNSKRNTGSLLSDEFHLSSSELDALYQTSNNNKIDMKKDLNETLSDSDEDNISNSFLSIKQTKDSQDIPNTINQQGRWTNEEHQLFIEGLVLYGNEWKYVQNHIKTRSASQSRSHAQKFFIKLRKQLIHKTELSDIKRKLYWIFQEEMNGEFKPNDIDSFLDKIIPMIYSDDIIIKRYFKRNQTFNKTELTIKTESIINSQNDEIEKDSNLLISINNIDIDLSLFKTQKKKNNIFVIEKYKKDENQLARSKYCLIENKDEVFESNDQIDELNETMPNSMTNMITFEDKCFDMNYNSDNINPNANANAYANDHDRDILYYIDDIPKYNPFELDFTPMIIQNSKNSHSFNGSSASLLESNENSNKFKINEFPALFRL